MASQIQIVVSKLGGFTAQAAAELARIITKNLDEDTPEDTTFAKTNWVPKIGSPFSGTAGEKTGRRTANIDLAPQTSGLSSLSKYRLNRAPIFVVNNAPYILRLNDGHSDQAPKMFIQMSIARSVREAGKLRGR